MDQLRILSLRERLFFCGHSATQGSKARKPRAQCSSTSATVQVWCVPAHFACAISHRVDVVNRAACDAQPSQDGPPLEPG